MAHTRAFFRGSGWTQVDAAGRIVVPTGFRRKLLEHYGAQVFVTQSFFPEYPHVVVYPLQVWENIEAEIHLHPNLNPLEKMAVMHRLNIRGAETELDDKGRVLIPQELREFARLMGRVVVVGYFNTLQVWHPDVLDGFQQQVPWTPELAQKIRI